MKINLPVLVVSITIAAIFVVGSTVLVSKIASRRNDSSPLNYERVLKTNKPAINYSNIDVQELKSYIDSDRDIYLLDVHIPEQEHITGTDDFIPFNNIDRDTDKLPEDLDTEIVVYCRSGNMSETASQTLIDMGYTNVKNLTGGINAWKAKGYSL